MHNHTFAWIRNRQLTIHLFVAIMVNIMTFSQPLGYALNNQHRLVNNRYSSSGTLNSSIVPVNMNNNFKPSINRKKIVLNKISTNNIEVNTDLNIIPSIEKQGIIGRSENLPIDELTDNIFNFELKNEVKKDKDLYLEYELFGLGDGSQAIKSINDQTATGGSIIKTTKEWTKVKEKINPSDIQKGKNSIKFTTWEQSRYQYMVRNLKLVYENKSIEMPIEFHQETAKSYSGTIAITGFIEDQSISKVTILGKDYPVINNVFEALVEEKEPKSNLSVSYIDNKGNKIENYIKVEQLLDKPTELHKETKIVASISKFFTKSQSNNLSFGGAKLQVDTLSLDENQKISIAGLRYIDLPILSPEMVNVTADYYGYRMLPHGDLFSKKPAKIFLKYDQAKLPTGYTAKDIKTFYFDNNQKRWMALEKDTVLDSSNEIVSKTNHFTDFINGIIKVPESPETGSFTPTSIKDIKAAEPTAGVVSIAPPTPNNMGTVNTSFPIKLPAGRSGMQPSLSVNYSSESGNGWMGLGWDMSIPGVSLDTRWGAPRYDAANETEIYSMGGGMLTMKVGAEYTNPHRKDAISRTYQDINGDGVVAERLFYPRIEGSYAKIIRHGSNPTNYWWEVTDKMGNKSFYGGYAGTVKNKAVIRTGAVTLLTQDKTVGNISYWGLCRTEDTNGNYVEYIYENNYGITAGGPGDGGNEFYIKEIKYTMHKTNIQPNYYKVDFLRTVGRVDKQINARNGVVQVTKDLLSEIKIGLLQDGVLKPIRSYEFDYDVHTFNKNQLIKISEFDASGELFYSNTMEYENKGVDRNTVSNTSFIVNGSSDKWSTDKIDVNGGLISGNAVSNISSFFSNKSSALGSSTSGGVNGGLYVGAGPGCSGTNLFTGGVNGGYSYSSGGGLTSFNDINGDGLPDKVYRKNGVLRFRPNLGNAGFGIEQNVSGITNISRNTSDSFSVGVQASFGVTVGATYNKSKSITSTYFSDVNGDGIVDLIDNGSVKFNKTNRTNYLTQATFNNENSSTQNPVGSGAVSDSIIKNIKLETLNQLRDQNPQHDIVKIWVAKKQGTITISGNASLDPYPSTQENPYPLNNTDPFFNNYDGVRLSIQKNDGVGSILNEGTLTPTFLGTTTSSTPNIVPQAFANPTTVVNVMKGDRIYFRLQSKEEGSFDRVSWNPSITYNDIATIDANGLDYFSSDADSGFIISSKSRTQIPDQDGVLSITWPQINLGAFAYSDDLLFEIERGTISSTGSYSTIATFQSSYNQTLTTPTIISSTNFSGQNLSNISIDSTGTSYEVFFFRVKSRSNVDWKALNWKPLLTFTAGATGAAPFKIYPVVDYQIYNKKINTDIISRVDVINTTLPLVIKPVLNQSFFQASPNSTLPDNKTYNINLVVKNSLKRVLATKNIAVNKFNGNINIATADIENIDISSNLTTSIYVEYYTSDLDLASLASDVSQPIKAEIYQANANPVATPLNFTLPTATDPDTTFHLNSVKLHTLNDSNLLNTPYYENRKPLTNKPNLIKSESYSIEIILESSDTTQLASKHAAVWVDYNRNGLIDLNPVNEFLTSVALNTFHSFSLLIPNTISDGNVFIRVRGGSNVPYNNLTFNDATIEGTIKDYQSNIVSYTNKFSKDIYCAVGNDKFGINYRGWGQFAYHGGIVVQRAPADADGNGTTDQSEQQEVVIDPVTNQPIIIAQYGVDNSGQIIPIEENALNVVVNSGIQDCVNSYPNPTNNPSIGQQLQNCLQNIPQQRSTSIRFFSLNPDGESLIYFGSSQFVNVDGTHFSSSRMGIKNLSTIFRPLPTTTTISSANCVYPPVSGIDLINKGEGKSFSGGISYGGVGGSANYSTSFNWSETNYMDLNGDRYPDILTKNNIQYTNALGALNETKNLGFGRVSSGQTDAFGGAASGTFVTATTDEPEYDINWSIGGTKATTKAQTKSSIGVTFSLGGGGNTDENLWIDMNGDGLLDRVNVSNGLNVRLNLGYEFEQTSKQWDVFNDSSALNTVKLNGKQKNVSVGIGFSYGANAFSGGLSVCASTAYTQKNLMDINGDGLPDLLLDDNGNTLTYRLNRGTDFGDISTMIGGGYSNFSRTTGEGPQASFTIPICIAGAAQINVSPSLGAEKNVTRTENTIEDINGDGFPDLLSTGAGGNETSDGELHARLSNIGTTNYLTKVNTPTGGSWEVVYERQAESNTFDMPQNKYVVTKISIFDGFTADNNWSPDRTITSIEYSKPYHDRREREFYGYEKVRVNQHGGYNTSIDLNSPITDFPATYRYSVQEFHNNNYYLKGALKKESLFDANNVMWTESKTTYGVYQPGSVLTESYTRGLVGFTNTTYNISTVNSDAINYGTPAKPVSVSTTNINFICTDLDKESLFVTPLVTVKTFTEGGTGLKYAVTAIEAIDAFGNIKQYRDYGEQADDVYVSKIEYNPITIDGFQCNGYPSKIQVFDNNGSTLKRERKATYDTTGNLETIITKLNGTENASVTMEYDPDYGNLSKVINENSINPANGSKFFKKYTYDDVLHTFPTRVEDAFGYYSTSNYNYLFGIPVYTTDMNMQPMRTRIDDRGRPIEITGPYELYLEGISGGAEPAWTIRFEYGGDDTAVNLTVASRVANYASDQFGPDPAETFNGMVNAVGSFNAIVPDNNNENDPTNVKHHALTRHFDPEYRTDGYNTDNVTTTNQILTATIVDGFGKPVQVKKSSAIFDGSATAQPQGNAIPNPLNDNIMVWLLNGKAKTDEYGRAIKSYYPTTQSSTFSGGPSDFPANAFTYDNLSDNVAPTEATYDVLDRSLTTKLPGEADETTMEYGIDNNSFLTKVTNEMTQVQKSFTDIRGRTTLTEQESATGNISTSFKYNNIGELKLVTDVADNKTQSEYDLAGRRTELRHPDNGITKFTYDQASNLTKRQTSNLLQAGTQAIEYKYTYNRLDEIKYPQFPENNVHYYYGTANNSDASNDNAVGRLWYHVDATGTQYFKYGKLGELTKNRRSIAVPGDRVYWFQTDWTYDTWNRVKTIKYPDEELVTYRYNKAGELHAMTSEKNGVQNKNIISQLGYDKFGQRTYLRYGNGTETTYNYQAERRRLDRMNVKSTTTFGATTARTFINNKYSYDVLSNVLSIQNTTADPTPTQIGGRSSQFYGYDDLNRLTTASGNFVGRNENQIGFNHNRYTLSMGYDSQHNITTKVQGHQTASGTATTPVAAAWTGDKTEQTNYALDYQDYNTAGFNVAGYAYGQPHAPRTIIDQPVAPGTTLASDDPRIKTKKYEYDYNGNQTKTTQTVCAAPEPELLRENLWDEENRLRAIDLNPSSPSGGGGGLHPISIYTYDAGGERIVKQNSATIAIYENAKNVGSSIKSDFMLYPSGMLVFRPSVVANEGGSYTKHYFAGSQRVSSKIGTTTNFGKFLEEWTLQENSDGGAAINLVATSQIQLTKAETGVTKVYTAFSITPSPSFNSNTAFVPVQAFAIGAQESEQYYFHPDHLGSSNYITNIAGDVSQHMEYFAFGETFVEEHKNSINSPYKFNGKELDEESGLSYFGARYYDSKVSLWLSVDPLAEKGPQYSPYCYTFNNPINLTDPDGRWPDPPFGFNASFRIGYGSSGWNFKLNASIGYGGGGSNLKGVSFAGVSVYAGNQIGTSFMTRGLNFDATVGGYATLGTGSGTSHTVNTLNPDTPSGITNDFRTSATYGQMFTFSSAINAERGANDGGAVQRLGLVGVKAFGNMSLTTSNDTGIMGGGRTDKGQTGNGTFNVGGFSVSYLNYTGSYDTKQEPSNGGTVGFGSFYNQSPYQQSLNQSSFRIDSNGTSLLGGTSNGSIQNAIHSVVGTGQFIYPQTTTYSNGLFNLYYGNRNP